MRKSIFAFQAFFLASSLIASSALAAGPLHLKFTSGPFADDYAAGELCSFAYHSEYMITYNIKRFFDADGNVVRAVRNEDLWVLHRNAETGQTFTETDHYTLNIDWVNGVVASSGQNWHLRDEDGRMVLVRAGRFIQDAFTGEILWWTPKGNPDILNIICTALGGTPAP